MKINTCLETSTFTLNGRCILFAKVQFTFLEAALTSNNMKANPSSPIPLFLARSCFVGACEKQPCGMYLALRPNPCLSLSQSRESFARTVIWRDCPGVDKDLRAAQNSRPSKCCLARQPLPSRQQQVTQKRQQSGASKEDGRFLPPGF